MTNGDGGLDGDSENERRSAVILAPGVSAELGPQIIDDASKMPDARPENELHDEARMLNGEEKGKKGLSGLLSGVVKSGGSKNGGSEDEDEGSENEESTVSNEGSTARNKYFGLVALAIGCVALL